MKGFYFLLDEDVEEFYWDPEPCKNPSFFQTTSDPSGGPLFMGFGKKFGFRTKADTRIVQ